MPFTIAAPTKVLGLRWLCSLMRTSSCSSSVNPDHPNWVVLRGALFFHSNHSVQGPPCRAIPWNRSSRVRALPDLRSGQSSRRPPPRWSSTRSAAASPLPLPLACGERRVASDHCGGRSRAQRRRLRRERRIFRWGAMSCGGSPGLGGDVHRFPVCTQPELDNDIHPGYRGTQLTLVTTTCLETVVPVIDGTCAASQVFGRS